MFLVDADPDHANGIIRSGLERRLGVARIGIPEEIRVVVEDRHVEDAGDTPIREKPGDLARFRPSPARRRARRPTHRGRSRPACPATARATPPWRWCPR